MKFQAVALLVLVGAAAAVPSGSEPVDRVVVLLKTLEETITKDGENDDKLYNKFACWCDKTVRQKAENIEAAQAELRSSGQKILQLKGQVEVHESEHAEYVKAIKDAEDEMATRTTLRAQKNGVYQAQAAETQEVMASLEAAITTLAAATNQSTALLQEATSAQSRNAVREVLDKLPSTIPSLPANRIALLSEFAQATSGAGYSPQSATIQGTLGDMYATFAANLESSTQDEADQNGVYETDDGTDAGSLKGLKDDRDANAKTKSEAVLLLAETTNEYDVTAKTRVADIAFFDATKTACEKKHLDNSVRTTARAEELAGLAKAIGILTSDDNRALFDTAIKPGLETVSSFLQISSTPSLLQGGTAAVAAKAYNILKAKVKSTHSLELAALAVQVRTTKAGHFDNVITAIDAMQGTLAAEETADKEKKAECKTETQKANKSIDDLSWKIEVNNADIAKFESLLVLRRAEKAAATKKKSETSAAITELNRTRGLDNAAWIQDRTDDQNAITVLESAKTALARPTVGSFVKILDNTHTQSLTNAAALIGQIFKIREDVKGQAEADDRFPYKIDAYDLGPGFSEDSFQEKDVQLTEATGVEASQMTVMRTEDKHAAATMSLLATFSNIITDLHNEIASDAKAEAAATTEHLAAVGFARDLVIELGKKETSLNSIIGQRGTDKADVERKRTGHNNTLTAKKARMTEISPDCDFTLSTFTERATARASEAEGLRQAKAFLAGQTALIAESSKPTKSLRQIHFLGMH